MNQQRLETIVLDGLQRAAAKDPLEWVPVLGHPGLGFELFGPEPTRAQLRVFARVLFRLATSDQIDVAWFHPNQRTGRLGRPHSEGTVAAGGLAGGGSQPLSVDSRVQYGVRLKAPRAAEAC